MLLTAGRGWWRTACGAVILAGLVAAVVLHRPLPGATAAQPAAGLPAELQYVPPDAAFFVHAETAKFWAGPIGTGIRDADKQVTADVLGSLVNKFGVSPEQLRTVTLFWPRFKGPQDAETFGAVLSFKAAFDKDKLKAGIEKEAQGLRVAVHFPAETTAVVFAGFPADATPKAAVGDGPLAPAIREAASGTHLLVVAANMAKLPDELRDAEKLPEDVRPFLPLLRADTITALIDMNNEFAVEARVKCSTAARAAEAEKALGLLVGVARKGLDGVVRQFTPDEKTDQAGKDLFALLSGVRAGLKGATFTTTGTEARARVAVPADLPFGQVLGDTLAKVRAAADRVNSSSNLKQIGLAMHYYIEKHGSLPPAAVVDKRGKPLLSWRVLVLPYLEEGELYKQFKLDEPWDSENNKKLLDRRPKVYALPMARAAKANETHYRALVGNGAALDLFRGVKVPQFVDGMSKTILVATAADPVPWTKPDDIAFDPDKDTTRQLGFLGGDSCLVMIADGSIRVIDKSITREKLHAMITRAGGEVVNDE